MVDISNILGGLRSVQVACNTARIPGSPYARQMGQMRRIAMIYGAMIVPPICLFPAATFPFGVPGH